jgi:hypothetical protein
VATGPDGKARPLDGAVRRGHVIRPFHVLNGLGEQLAAFATWDAAHQWAHEVATMRGPELPLEVEDRMQRITRRITATSCELIAWTVFTKIGGCEPVEEAPRVPPYLS